jgi:hypothetical protein
MSREYRVNITPGLKRLRTPCLCYEHVYVCVHVHPLFINFSALPSNIWTYWQILMKLGLDLDLDLFRLRESLYMM